MRKLIISLVLIFGIVLAASCAVLLPQPNLSNSSTDSTVVSTIKTTTSTVTAGTFTTNTLSEKALRFIDAYNKMKYGAVNTTGTDANEIRKTKKTTTTTTKKSTKTTKFTIPELKEIHYGDLPPNKQKEYAAERDALDAAALDDLQKIKDKIEDYEDKIKSASAQNSPEAIRLQQQINRLELEKQDKVGEAMAQSGGQWNSYAQSISDQYDALIAAKRQQLNSLKPDTSKLQYEIDQLKTLASMRYERYKFELQILNDKYGIVG